MTVYTFHCGFEIGSSSEYTGATSLTVENTYKWYSPYYAKILANGNVYWTVDYHALEWNTVHMAHVRLPLSSHVKPLKTTRTATEYSVSIDDTASETRTFTIKAGASSYTVSYYVPANAWVDIVQYLSFFGMEVYVDGVMIYSDSIQRSTANDDISEIRAEASTASGSSVLYLDDVILYNGDYSGTIGVVYPYVPDFPQQVYGLNAYPVSTNHISKISEYTSDGDSTYIYRGSAGEGYDYYSCSLSNGPSGKTLKTILSVKLVATARCVSTRTTEAVRFGLRIGHDGTPFLISSTALTTSYADYQFDFESVGTQHFTPEMFQMPTSDTNVQVGIYLTGTASSQARCTKFRGSLAILFQNNPSRFGMSADIISTGGWDISFDVDTTSWSTYDYLAVYTNVVSTAIGKTGNYGYTKTGVQLENYSGSVYVMAGPIGDTGVAFSERIKVATSGKLRMRFVMHDTFISVFESDRWIYTFTLLNVSYPSILTLYIRVSVQTTVTNLVCSELCDWREATYIDTETSIASGISSVIQQRPVEIVPLQGGIVDFSYNRSRSNVNAVNILRHTKDTRNNSSAGSHLVVYYRDVAMVVDENFMDSNGYTTRVLQMSELESGAVEAAKLSAQRGREAQEAHTLECSPDIRIEPGDKVTISYTLSGTGRVVSDAMIAESVDINIQEGNYQMVVEGRKYV